ncbi:MAG: ATP-binding protein [Microgenomates group bacterium]|jgi:signal transduction histidine kinase
MDPIALGLFLFGNSIFISLFFVYLSRFKKHTRLHETEMEEREKQLKHQVFELAVLRSLSERAGYSLDLRQILEVITDSLSGLVQYATVSYIMMGLEGRTILKIHAAEGVSQEFIDNVKKDLTASYSTMSGKKVTPGLIDETVSGGLSLEGPSEIGSTFNLPMMIGSDLAALINVSSIAPGVYKEADTKILYTILSQVSASASKLSLVVENEKRRLSAMVMSLTDGIAMIDSSFRMTVSNSALASMLGIKKVESLMEIVAGVGVKVDLEHAIKQALISKNIVALKEVQLNQKYVQIDVEPVIDQYGYLLGAAVVFRDVTAARELDKMRDEFTAMMVHELRTPLTTITYGTADLMTGLEKLSTADIAKTIGVIQSTTGEMLDLVNDLLDAAKIESGKFEITKKEDDLVSLINEKITMFKPTTDQKGLKLVSEVTPTLAKLPFDRRRIGQTLDNLLSNAIKYTDKGSVTIKAEITDDHVMISVVDTGDGMKSEDIAKLFSKFEQFGKGKSGERKGTGLGLVVAKGIVEAHNGKIWGSSTGLGKGSTFAFTLPLK